MRTLIIVGLGILLAIGFLALGRAVKTVGVLRAGVAFTVLWTIAMIVNMFVGMSHGYTFSEEFPILLLNVIPPVAVALGGGYYLRRRS